MNPEIILGPPGTGKTTTLIQMVQDEIASGTPPDRIGYVSFTRRAAEEAMTRACERFGRKPADFPYFRTLHSLCFRALGMSSSDVIEGPRLQEFAALVGMKITGQYSLEDGTSFGFERGDRILFMENLARVRCMPLRQLYDEGDDEISWWEVERVARALAQFKKDSDLLDYTDMLAQFVASGWSPQLDVLLVDEAQDLSALQWQVVLKLAASARRVVVAGDDDQAIYRWAGADVDHFVDLRGQSRVLSQSYRVPTSVQRVASTIVDKIERRRPKEWSSRPEAGEVEYVPDFMDVDLAGEDVLVLARNTYILRGIERYVRGAGLLYEFRSKRSIRPQTVAAVRDWTSLTAGKTLTVADARNIYSEMSSGRGVARGHKTLPGRADDDPIDYHVLRDECGLLVEQNTPWYTALDRLSSQDREYLRAILRRGSGKLPERATIRLSTIHGMKGGEADRVVLLTDMANRTHQEMYLRPDDEARVWYVAVTRARRALHVVRPKTDMCYEL